MVHEVLMKWELFPKMRVVHLLLDALTTDGRSMGPGEVFRHRRGGLALLMCRAAGINFMRRRHSRPIKSMGLAIVASSLLCLVLLSF